MTTLAEHIGSAQVIVCCGSGGVGKTTIAAALGLHAARLGRRAVVATIDPAKRLADALGPRIFSAQFQYGHFLLQEGLFHRSLHALCNEPQLQCRA